MSFTDKICVVTGGANGIGRCLVERFAAAGARVAFMDLDAASGGRLAKKIGKNCLFAAGDIAREAVLSRFAGRVGRPEDIAAAVMFLCSPEAAFITGQNLVVDGGMTRRMIYHGDAGWTFAPPD